MAAYQLPDLPYDYSALAPQMSAEQLELHHSKHHAAYVKKANELLDQLSGADPAAMPSLAKAYAFNLSGHVLHSLFWQSMTPGGTAPEGALRDAIDETFGSLESLSTQLGAAITTLMGSGWGALVWEPVAGRLLVAQLRDHQDNVPGGTVPLLVVDGWEHAFYVDHRNDKQAWVDSVSQILDWSAASRRFEAARDAGVVTSR